MPVSKKPRKKRTQIVTMPMPTPPVMISQQPQWYPIDWNKVKTIQDIKVILNNMGLGCFENAPNYQELKKYLSDKPNTQL